MKKLILLTAMILICSAIASALPDLTITGISIAKSTPCLQTYTMPNGTQVCSLYQGLENNSIHLRGNMVFCPRPLIKNIGNESTSSAFHYTSYIDGKWFVLNLLGAQIRPNESLGAGIFAGCTMAGADGSHIVTMYINEPNFTKDYLVHPTIEELDYNNNLLNWTFISDGPTNHPPVINSVISPSSANETDIVSVSFNATDTYNDIASYTIKLDGEVVANSSSYQWHTENGDDGEHTFEFIAKDGRNATDTETRNVNINDLDLCVADDNCTDEDDETWEACDGSEYNGHKLCNRNKTYTLYGHVVDSHNGNNLKDKKVSIIDKNTYNPENGAGDYEAMQPKEMPDASTNGRGFWYANLNNGIYHFIVNGSKEEEYEAYVNTSKGKEKRDAELNENITSTNFNAEGHILYSGEYNGNNKYICGERVKFTMFGVNNGGTDETITFSVQDHTSEGGPTAPVIYTGSISNSTESLTVVAGNKTHKTFYWRIPCGLDYGRYDIHVIWNDEQWHKIGNFFLEEDVTAPGISAVPGHLSAQVNQNFTIQYSAWDYPQPGTIIYYKIMMLGYNDTSVNVSIDMGNDGSVEYTSFGGDWLSYTGSFNTSGEKQIKLTVTDLSGNNASTFVNVTEFITEDEADAIAIPWYNQFLLNDTTGLDFVFDIDIDLGSSGVSLNADRFAGPPPYCWEEQVGDEYMTPGNTVGTEQYGDYYSLTDVVYGNEYGSGCSGPEYFLPINGTTAVGYNHTLVEYFCYLDNVCGIGVEEPLCDTYNFAPKIYAYIPQLVNLEIPHTSSKSFSVNVNDANNGNITVKWYIDDVLNKTTNFTAGSGGGTNSFTFIGSESNHGLHKIYVGVFDPNGGAQNLDPYNYWTNITWYLLVT